MKNKKSFILYADLIHTVNKLPNDKAGELFKHILSYVNDENPTTGDLIINISFEPIKQQLKRDLIHWENIKVKRSLAGSKGGRPLKANKANGSFVKQTKAKKAVNVNVNVNDNVNVINNKEGNNSFEKFWNHFHKYVNQTKSKKEPTLKHWNKLNKADQEKAYSAVENYSKSKDKEDHVYLSIARTYLSDKLFNDEYETNNKQSVEDVLKVMKKYQNEK